MPRTPNSAKISCLVLGLASACGLERDWAAFQDAFADDSTSGGDTSTTTTPQGSDTSGTSSTVGDSSTGGSSGSTGEADASSGTSGEADTSTGSTGEPPAVCGDGVVAGDEQCDDANDVDIDECDNACARAWTIFVTSEANFDGNINGLVGSGNRCRGRAAQAMLPRWKTYVALLSDSTTSAADRLHHARGWYRLANGLPVAHGWDALMNGTLENPVNVTELSTTLNAQVWTGTLPGGSAVPGAQHCEDWTSNLIFDEGHYGSSNLSTSAWLYDPDPETNPQTCGFVNKSLYCIEQP